MLSKCTVALVLFSLTLSTLPAYATSPAPDAASSAPARETAADQAVPNLFPSDPSAPISLDRGTPALTPDEGLQQKYSLVPASGSGEIDKFNGSYLKGYFTDTAKILSSPLHWQSQDWLKAGAVVGVTASLFLVDQNVRDFSQNHQSTAASKFDLVGNALGNGFYILPGVGAAYLYGHLADDHKLRRTALLALESYAVSGLMTEGLKLAAERHRPNSGDSNMSWDGPSVRGRNVSFSSGHTASAFSIATVVANEYGDNAWVPPIAYGLATLTGLSRIYSNEHWGSDVFFGAALGYFVTKGVLSLHKEDKNSLLGSRLSLMPKVGKQMTGLEVKYNF